MTRSPFVRLLTARRFAPLFLTQFLGAFNDNLLKASLGIFVTYRVAEESGLDAASLVMLAGARVHRAVLPVFRRLGDAGGSRRQSSDRPVGEGRRDRHHGGGRLRAVAAEYSAAPRRSLWIRHPFDGVRTDQVRAPAATPARGRVGRRQRAHRSRDVSRHSARHDPRRQHRALRERCAGRRWGRRRVRLRGDGCCRVRFPRRRRPLGDDAPRPRLFRDSIDVVRHVTRQSKLLLPVLAVSWFWLFGATVVSGLPVLAKDVLFADEHVVTLMLALFAVGVGVGSLLAERLLHGDVSARHVPLGGCVMAGCAVDLYLATVGRPRTTRVGHAGRLSPAIRAAGGFWRIWSGSRWAGGLFTVPLYAILQHESEPSHRARVIAANNIINALAMTRGRRRGGSVAGARDDDGRALRVVRRSPRFR